MILECYLGAFADACKSAGGWYSLDLFAGTGLNWSETRSVEINGSPLIALEAESPKAIQVIAAEENKRAHEALRHRTEPYGDRAEVIEGDANSVVGEMLAGVPQQAPSFAFLDPEGSELAWPTVEAVADHQRGHSPTKVEQLILFPTDTGFIRLIPEYPEKVSRIYGHERWKAIYERRIAGQIDVDQARGEYVQLYAAGLKELGYKTVLDRQIEKDDGHPMYFLIFATDHAAGERIMDHCFDHVRLRVQEQLGQTQLFPVKEAPRRKRLGDS